MSMQKISPLQEYFPTDWSGLTTDNHLGAIYATEPQVFTKMVTRLYASNYGINFGAILDKYPTKVLESDDDFVWYLQGSSAKNIGLIEARIGGTAVVASDYTGKAGARFELVFSEAHFSDTNLIVGEKNSIYPIRILEEPTMDGNNWVYVCELFTGDKDLFIPFDELLAGKRFSKEWSIVERTLSKKGGTPNYTSPFRMKNGFSMIRMEDTRPGDMINKPVAFSWATINPVTKKEELQTTWMDYADWEFEVQFQNMKDKLLNYATTNRTEDGNFLQKGKSGFTIEQGAGLEQQVESSNLDYYSSFDVKTFTEGIMSVSDNARSDDTREVVVRTGRWGAIQFHEDMERISSLWTPIQNSSRIYMINKTDMGYKGRFREYEGPDGTKLSVIVDPMYDDTERNKIMHPSGNGVAQSYTYSIYNLGTSDGEPNIQKVTSKKGGDIYGFVPGLRHPWKNNGENEVMSVDMDGYKIHRAAILGIMVKDPTRCITWKHNSIAA